MRLSLATNRFLINEVVRYAKNQSERAEAVSKEKKESFAFDACERECVPRVRGMLCIRSMQAALHQFISAQWVKKDHNRCVLNSASLRFGMSG